MIAAGQIPAASYASYQTGAGATQATGGATNAKTAPPPLIPVMGGTRTAQQRWAWLTFLFSFSPNTNQVFIFRKNSFFKDQLTTISDASLFHCLPPSYLMSSARFIWGRPRGLTVPWVSRVLVENFRRPFFISLSSSMTRPFPFYSSLWLRL